MWPCKVFCSYLYTLVNICICVTPRPVVTGQVSAHQLSLPPQQSSVWAEQSIAGQGTAEQCVGRAELGEHALRVSQILGIHLQTIPCAIPVQYPLCYTIYKLPDQYIPWFCTTKILIPPTVTVQYYYSCVQNQCGMVRYLPRV